MRPGLSSSIVNKVTDGRRRTQTTEKLGGPRVTQFLDLPRNKVRALLDVRSGCFNELHDPCVRSMWQDFRGHGDSCDRGSDPERADIFLERRFPLRLRPRGGGTQGGRDRIGAGCWPRCSRPSATSSAAMLWLTRPRGRTRSPCTSRDNECAIAVLQSHQFVILGHRHLAVNARNHPRGDSRAGGALFVVMRELRTTHR